MAAADQPWPPANICPSITIRSLFLCALPPWPMRTNGRESLWTTAGRHRIPGMACPSRSILKPRSQTPSALTASSVQCSAVMSQSLLQRRSDLAEHHVGVQHVLQPLDRQIVQVDAKREESPALGVDVPGQRLGLQQQPSVVAGRERPGLGSNIPTSWIAGWQHVLERSIDPEDRCRLPKHFEIWAADQPAQKLHLRPRRGNIGRQALAVGEVELRTIEAGPGDDVTNQRHALLERRPLDAGLDR